MYGKHDALVTNDWREPPRPDAESTLIGRLYEAFLAQAPLRAVTPTARAASWRAFPHVSLTDSVREVRAGRQATDHAGLTGGDELATAELIVRYQLMHASGQLTETARLDPESYAHGLR
jgi:hypothetical protein